MRKDTRPSLPRDVRIQEWGGALGMRLTSPDLSYGRKATGEHSPFSEVLHHTVVDLSEHLQILPLTKEYVRLHNGGRECQNELINCQRECEFQIIH